MYRISPCRKRKRMSKSKNPEAVYQTERLLKSKALAGYQQDFARVILVKPFYTIKEARAALDAVLKKGE